MDTSNPTLYQQAAGEFEAGRYSRAESLAHRALGQHPDDPETLQVLALSVARLGRVGETIAYLERAVQSAPDHPQCHYNLAVTCQQAGLRELAILSYRNTLRLAPHHADALWNLGELYRLGGHFEEAAAHFESLIDMGRIYPDLHHRLAVALNGLGRREPALHHFDQALAGNTTNPALTHWEQSHALLALGRFAQGWQSYDYRFEAGELTGVHCHDFPHPRWRGESLEGKTLLVHGEQGLGDEIMFGSILPELADEAGRLILACQAPLVRLFAQSMPGVEVYAHNVSGPAVKESDLGPVDFQIPMGSLPAIRRRTLEAFDPATGYLRADTQRTSDFEKKLAAMAPAAAGKLKVGLMWGSNPAQGVDWGMRRARRKSIGPASLAPLATLRDRIVFVSLHNQDLASQAAAVPVLDPVDFHRDLLDMADTAALIDSLDVVISVDTSVAHLAGALGQRTWVLLMERCDWRWPHGADTSAWYPRVRLLRQQSQGDWQPVVGQLHATLAGLVQEA